jgi:hypothetical protein
LAQPIINERYTINDETNAIFSTVILTGDQFIVSGLQSSMAGFNDNESSLSYINFEGVLDSINVYSNDSLGISFMQHSKMVLTLDNQLAHIALAATSAYPYSYMFYKMTMNGDTILTSYFPEFYEDSNEGLNPSTLIQDTDSSYFGIVHIYNNESLVGGFTFFRLDKNGNLLYKKNFYGDSPSGFNALTSASMIKTGENELMIGCAYRRDYGETEDKRHHTRLYKIDTLGEVLETHTNLVDTFNLDCNSLTKTSDGGYLYCGRVGRYYPEPNGILYRMHVVKLNADYSVDWKLPFGVFTGGFATNFSKILPLNETEFVVTGYYPADEYGIMGCLLKFNIDGELLWHRKYRKVTKWGGGGEHYLYDVERTPDDGFVMVGQAIDNLGYSDLPGQKAWLRKNR